MSMHPPNYHVMVKKKHKNATEPKPHAPGLLVNELGRLDFSSMLGFMFTYVACKQIKN